MFVTFSRLSLNVNPGGINGMSWNYFCIAYGQKIFACFALLTTGNGNGYGWIWFMEFAQSFFFRCEFFYGQCYYTMAGKRVGWTGYRFFKFTFFLLTPILKGIMAGRYNDMLGYEYD